MVGRLAPPRKKQVVLCSVENCGSNSTGSDRRRPARDSEKGSRIEPPEREVCARRARPNTGREARCIPALSRTSPLRMHPPAARETAMESFSQPRNTNPCQQNTSRSQSEPPTSEMSNETRATDVTHVSEREATKNLDEPASFERHMGEQRAESQVCTHMKLLERGTKPCLPTLPMCTLHSSPRAHQLTKDTAWRNGRDTGLNARVLAHATGGRTKSLARPLRRHPCPGTASRAPLRPSPGT